MRKLSFVVSLVCLSTTVVLGQSKVSVSWTCAKPATAQSIEVGDKPDHAYSIAQFKCAATKGEISDVKDKEGTGTEFDEATGNSSSGHGIYVETMANGDKIHYSYQSKATTKNGQLQSASNKWEATDGTGKFKGIKASGTCAGTGKPDGSAAWTCTGTYALSK